MLRVSIHAGPLAKISRSNRLDWIDIGYQKLVPATVPSEARSFPNIRAKRS
jgi:hypothetical protein